MPLVVEERFLFSQTTSSLGPRTRQLLRNYEGVITTYTEPDDYKSVECTKNCKKCVLQLELEENEKTAVGIEKLLTDAEKTISLVPKGNLRIDRRKKAYKPLLKIKNGT